MQNGENRESAEQREQREQKEREEQGERAEQGERTELRERGERAEQGEEYRTERTGRTYRTERTGRMCRTERTCRTGRTYRTERMCRTRRKGKTCRTGRTGRTCRTERTPIQPSRESNLLPSLLGGTCSQTRWVTAISTAVIDFLPINQARLNFYRFCPFQGILRTLWKVVMPFIRVVLVFNNNHQTCSYIEKLNTTVSLNQHHIHLIYSSQYPLKWTEPVKIQSCLVYRQKIKYCGL